MLSPPLRPVRQSVSQLLQIREAAPAERMEVLAQGSPEQAGITQHAPHKNGPAGLKSLSPWVLLGRVRSGSDGARATNTAHSGCVSW